LNVVSTRDWQALAATLLLALSGCASSRSREFLLKHTPDHVYEKPIRELWPTVKALLEERGFPGEEKGAPYHLETATLTPEGKLPSATSQSSSAAPTNGRSGTGGKGGRRPGGPVADHSNGELWRFVADGESIDDTHCRVAIVRFARDNVDSPESDPIPDVDLEWALILRVEPEKAAAIRREATAAGVELSGSH
jgi:hypothetical protein